MAGRALAALAVCIVIAATAAAATRADRTWPTGAPVASVDTTEGALAAGLGWTPKGCEGAVLWVPWRFARYAFRLPKPCPAVSTGRGVSAVAVTDGRVFFLSYVGGNTREWRLWTVTPTARRPKLVRAASADADRPSPIVLGNGGDGGVPYAVGTSVVVVKGSGARGFSWTAPSPVVSLSEASGAVAAVLANGHVALVDMATSSVRDIAFDPGVARTARPTYRGVVIETTDGIELVRSGVEKLPVPAGSHLAGFYDGGLFYWLGGKIYDYDRFNHKTKVARYVGAPLVADYDRLGLAWAHGTHLCWSVGLYADPYRDSDAHGCR